MLLMMRFLLYSSEHLLWQIAAKGMGQPENWGTVLLFPRQIQLKKCPDQQVCR
jgi:hypothetical protein